MDRLTHSPPPWTVMGDEIYSGDGKRIAEAVSTKDIAAILALPDLIKTLQQVADIAHCGGLVGLTEAEALIAVRRLTLPIWNSSAVNKGLSMRVKQALYDSKLK